MPKCCTVTIAQYVVATVTMAASTVTVGVADQMALSAVSATNPKTTMDNFMRAAEGRNAITTAVTVTAASTPYSAIPSR
ncbi:hypothetical protein GCM10025876_02800 [Demequina litorisediminis]|uniref:Secreted protein n=1 Tax=Demequina litorisediminis TaxID=1849022 RepID=A0ABQ6I8Q4_9MICO|nr:hypothetical protein GCM10025876_02800 [Demequina litorisediminis]